MQDATPACRRPGFRRAAFCGAAFWRASRRLTVVAALVPLAAACTPGGNPFAPPPEPVYRSDTYVPGASAIVCYRTLAAPDCYARPQPGPPNRVIAAYDELYPPAPIAPAGPAADGPPPTAPDAPASAPRDLLER